MADQTLDQLPQAGSADLADLLYAVKFGTLSDVKVTVGQVLSNAAPVEHTHGIDDLEALFGNQDPQQAGAPSAGSVSQAARVDHVHPPNVSSATPQPLGAATA